MIRGLIQRLVERADEAFEVDKQALLVPGEQVRDTIIGKICR
jgi:hypothetical protein